MRGGGGRRGTGGGRSRLSAFLPQNRAQSLRENGVALRFIGERERLTVRPAAARAALPPPAALSARIQAARRRSSLSRSGPGQESLRDTMRQAEAATADGSALTLTVALSYSGRCGRAPAMSQISALGPARLVLRGLLAQC